MATRTTLPRELAYRIGDGVEVSLMWHPDTDRLTVTVVDCRSGDGFEVPVGDSRPLDVFEHPYYFAALQGIAYAGPAPAVAA